MRKLAIVLTMLLTAPLAQADRQYWAFAPGYANLEDLEFGMVTALYGFELHPHIALEGRVGTTLLRDEEYVLGEKYKAGVDFLGSAFVRLNILTKDVRPYALLGGSYAKASVSGPISGSDEESGFSWGGGMSLHVREHGFFLEYIRHLDKSDAEFYGINLGYIGRF